MPKISVIMSIYKEPVEWVRQSIDSILAQTFSDFEFIIVNDRPDRIENTELLNEYKLKGCRIVVLANETNIGLTKSLNRALDIATGVYIARMDADDISLSHRFQTQVDYLDMHPEICGCGSWTGSIKLDEGRSRESFFDSLERVLVQKVHENMTFVPVEDNRTAADFYDEHMQMIADSSTKKEFYSTEVLTKNDLTFRKKIGMIYQYYFRKLI